VDIIVKLDLPKKPRRAEFPSKPVRTIVEEHMLKMFKNIKTSTVKGLN
jgi:hypothetical protein